MPFFQLGNISMFFILSFMISVNLMSSEKTVKKKKKKSASMHIVVERSMMSTPLLLHAVQEGELDIVKKLLIGGADPDEADIDGWTPLMEAVVSENLDIVLILLEYEADPNIKDKSGNTALILALTRIYEAIEKYNEGLKDPDFFEDSMNEKPKDLLELFTLNILNRNVLLIVMRLMSYGPCKKALLEKPSDYKARIAREKARKSPKYYKL